MDNQDEPTELTYDEACCLAMCAGLDAVHKALAPDAVKGEPDGTDTDGNANPGT